MAPPPAKRQKRLAVLGSDDEQIIIESLKSKDIVKHQRDSKPKRGFPANSNGTTTEPLTIRNRAKATQSSNPNSKVNVVSQVASTSTSKASSRKSEHMEKQPSRPISSFFVATSQTRLSNGRRQQYKADIAEKESEGEDLIEDDDYTEGGDESRGLQDTTRSILDRRERHTAPLHSGSVATNKENLPSGSQRFKFTCHSPGEVPDFDAAVPVRATSSEPDLRPWAEKYGPLNLEELMVHKKKVSDVRKWLEDVLRGHERKVTSSPSDY